MLSIHRSRGADLRNTFELVINGAQVDGGIVAGDGDVGNLHQLVPLISLAGKFFQSIGVISQSTQLVLHIHHPSLGGQAKPGTGVVVPQGFVLHVIVAVGVLRVGVPLGFRADLAVLIGHNDVGFSRGLAGELKGHVGKPVHIGFSALADLHKLEVAANDLVIGCISVTELDDLPVLADLERAHGLIGVEVALPRLGLHHLVGSIGQGPGVRLGDAVHHFEGGAYFAGGIKSAVHIHGVDALVCDFKKRPIQRSAPQGCKKPGFQVALFNEHAAPHHFVRHGKLVDHAVIADGHGLVGGCQQHTLIGGAFMQDVLPIGEQVIRRAGLALRVGDQGLDHLAGLVFLALYHDGVSAVVDDFKGNPRKISVALGGGACDGIRLLQGKTATFYIVYSSDCNRVAVLAYSDRFPGPGKQHGFISLGLPNLVGAVGQDVATGAGVA